MLVPIPRRVCDISFAGIFLFLFVIAASGAPTEEWLFRSWQTEDGLPDNSVAGLAQTADDYLWVGTPTGLARFDGLRFDSFSLTNVIAAPNRGIITMLYGASGTLWLAMDRGGIVGLRGAQSKAFVKELPDFIPFNLAEDNEGSLWVSYRGGRLYRISGNTVMRLTGEQGFLETNDPCALIADAGGKMWFAKSGQVGFFKGGIFTNVGKPMPLPVRMSPAKHGGIWVCAGNHLYKFNEKGQQEDCGEFQPENNTGVSAMLEDRSGAVWLGTPFSGLFRYASGGFQMVPTSHRAILSLAEDHEGNIWVGTYGGGLDRVQRRAIVLEGAQEGLPFSSIQSICEDSAGTIWAVTQNGVLVHKMDGKWTSVPISEEWPGAATCVASGTNGAIWIGTRTHGLYHWQNGRFVDWDPEHRLVGKTFHTILVSKSGDVWAGQETPTAIIHIRGNHIDTLSGPHDSRIIRAMVEDIHGTIWAGPRKGVLLRITNGQLEDVSPRPAEDLASIRCLYATPDGSIWIGYAGWGLGRVKGGEYAEVNPSHGLFDGYISHIVDDGYGWIWFAANRGIFKVRQKDLDEAMRGKVARVRSVHYGRGEGLPSLQGTFGDFPNVLRSRDGKLWLPTQTALVVADPAKLSENPEPPPPLVTRVLVDERLAAHYSGIIPNDPSTNEVKDLAARDLKFRVPPGHRRIEFEFTALSFNTAENLQFRYRLKGLDEEWVETGTRRSATFLHLPSGRYTFELTARGSDGDWNRTESQFAFTVLPFFWQTWWFKLAVLALFTASIISVVRYVSFRRLQQRLRILEQQAALQKERARIAKDIHDDLGANLTQIAFLGELAHQDRGEPEKAAERIGTISTTARQAIKSLDEIVWAVNPRNDTLVHLVDYAGQFAVDYLRAANIRCRLDFPEQIPTRELSTDLRHNLFLVIKEALHNIVKHAHATEVWLRLHFTGNKLDITVEDNGRGFVSEPNNAVADGLRNMRQRMEEIGGNFEVESAQGAGTKIKLGLPLPDGDVD